MRPHCPLLDEVSDCERDIKVNDARAPWQFDPLRSFERSLVEIEKWMPMSRRTRANLERALRAVDSDSRVRFLEKHRQEFQTFDRLGPVKYADLPYWAFRNVLLAQWLELDRARPLRILDIGTGSGSFAMVAQSMGHEVVGTDVANPWYDELCRLAGVTRRIAPVVLGEPYRVPGATFDLATVMQPAFHRRSGAGGAREYWSVDDWHRFLRGLVANVLAPDGRIFILMPLDKRDDGRLTYSPLLKWAHARGARLDRNHPGAPVRRILFDRPAEQLI